MKILLLITIILLFQSFPSLSEEKEFNYEQHKEKLIEKKLLLNSFKNCEEYINETSVELFLNCSDKYDTTLFEINKIKVIDLYFQNYSTPSIKLVKKFMNLVNNTEYNKLVAIHCTAGLGRTGLLICIWLIIKLNFTPKNAIAYIRMIRPGSIMGYQGVFLESIEHFRKFI